LKHFEPQELREVTRAAAQLGHVSMATLESLVEEFTSDFSVGASLLGDVGQAREMLADAVPPDQVADIMSDVLAAAERNIWTALGSVRRALGVPGQRTSADGDLHSFKAEPGPGGANRFASAA
jgi:flagellar motor switch protein FliG